MIIYLTLSPDCPVHASTNILWPQTELGKIARVPCQNAGKHFRLGPQAQRTCLESGHWGEVDMTACTLADGVKPFLLVWALVLTGEITTQTQEMLMNNVSVA